MEAGGSSESQLIHALASNKGLIPPGRVRGGVGVWKGGEVARGGGITGKTWRIKACRCWEGKKKKTLATNPGADNQGGDLTGEHCVRT